MAKAEKNKNRLKLALQSVFILKDHFKNKYAAYKALCGYAAIPRVTATHNHS